MWHRLWRASQSRTSLFQPEKFGYLREGSQLLLQTLADRITESGGEVRLGQAATGLAVRGGQVAAVETAAGEIPADLVVSAAPLPELARLLPAELADWRRELEQVAFLGVRCLRLRLDRGLTESYWINVNDDRVPFNGFIEYSNLNRGAEPDGAIAYVPLYLATDDPRYTMAAEDLTGELLRGLQIVAPRLEPSAVREALLTTDEYAQAVCPPGFGRRIPPLAGPARGLYLLDSTQLYPSDRCLSGMVGLARQLMVKVESG
jgi:protoporphyrinogen oxidase